MRENYPKVKCLECKSVMLKSIFYLSPMDIHRHILYIVPHSYFNPIKYISFVRQSKVHFAQSQVYKNLVLMVKRSENRQQSIKSNVREKSEQKMDLKKKESKLNYHIDRTVWLILQLNSCALSIFIEIQTENENEIRD